jgi:hypothetical protein
VVNVLQLKVTWIALCANNGVDDIMIRTIFTQLKLLFVSEVKFAEKGPLQVAISRDTLIEHLSPADSEALR